MREIVETTAVDSGHLNILESRRTRDDKSKLHTCERACFNREADDACDEVVRRLDFAAVSRLELHCQHRQYMMFRGWNHDHSQRMSSSQR